MSDRLSEADDAFLNEVFDLAVRRHATGEALDLDGLLVDRPHLRECVLRTVDLARDVAVVEAPRLANARLPVVVGFTLLEEVGRGGSGIVYRARQEALGRLVALKFLAPSFLASPRSRERFLAEAKALGRLRHPHVVAIHEVLAEERWCAYAMEWVEGMSLSKAIAAHDPRLDVAGVARLGVAVARALAAVHAAGLVHRDVKPGNILLRADGTPVLADFGLVRDEGHSLHTATGEFLGTAAYAAPEQLRGEHDRVGPRTDVYALGATLYAALTGQTPFGTSSTAEMLRRIESGLWTPVVKLNPRVPRDLATVVGKAMDPDPERRYGTAAELADDLERFLKFEPIRARRVGMGVRLLRLARRNRSAFAAATIASLLVLALATALGVSWKRRLERPARFREEIRQARSSLLDPDLNQRFFIAMNDPGSEAWELPLPAQATLDRALESYGRARALMPDDEAAALEAAVVAVARALLARERVLPAAAEPLRTPCPRTFEIAREWLAAGRPTDVALAGVDRMHLADRRHLGLLAFLCTRVPLCVKAWEALEAQPDFDDPLVGGALGEAWLVMDRPALAVPRLLRARKEFPESSFLTVDLADALVRTGDLARAQAMLDVAKRLPDQRNEGTPADLTRVEADLCVSRGERERARVLFYGMRSRPPTASFHLARFLAEEGDRASAFDCLGRIVLPWPRIDRYWELLLRLLEPVWSRLTPAERADVVAEAAHGRHQHVPLYAIGGVLRDRGWFQEPDPGAAVSDDLAGVPLRDLVVTPEVMRLLSASAFRSRPMYARALARAGLLLDSLCRRSSIGVGIGSTLAELVEALTPHSGFLLDLRITGRTAWDPSADRDSPTEDGKGGEVVPIPNVAGTGDVDRDGCDDVLVGDPSALDGRGEAWLCSGRSGRVLHTFSGQPGWKLGGSLSAAGDVDGDGTADLLVGGRGHVLVCSGRDGGVIRVLTGRKEGDRFGAAIASAGDVDGDGSRDVLVGAPGGAYVQVFSGRTGSVLHTFEGKCDFGSSVDGGHDADGDGVPDVLVGSPDEDMAPHGWNGRVSLFSSATGSLLWTESGATSFELLGASVAFLGDVNGDGLADWVVGAPEDERSGIVVGPGFVRIYGGPRGTLLRTLGGCGPGTGGFGAQVGPAGDLDGDGIQDLLVGADRNPDARAPDYVEVFSPGADYALLRTMSGPSDIARFGSPVRGNLDVDGDGMTDFVVGAPGKPGFARVFLGRK